jgi:hypothetical protein
LTTRIGRANLLIVLLVLTTTLRRFVVLTLVFLVWTPVAHAWSWPVKGPVLQPFAYDEAHPYASGQHRGIDIGADATGEPVVASAAGSVSFAGTVPTSGQSVTIETADGYSVTLTHLGSIVVAKGEAVTEGEEVGTIGPSGTPELDGPYVHLGIRVTTDPNGYVDPLSLLPPVPQAGGSDSGSTTQQPNASGGSSSSTAPTSAPAPTATTTTPATGTAQKPAVQGSARRSRPHASRHERGRAHVSQANRQPQGSSQLPSLSQPVQAEPRMRRHAPTPHRRVSEPARASLRPVVEVAASPESTDLDTGHELEPRVSAVHLERQHNQPSNQLLAVAFNGAAAMVALAAAFAAGRRRRRDLTVVGAQVLHLPQPSLGRRVRRAA